MHFIVWYYMHSPWNHSLKSGTWHHRGFYTIISDHDIMQWNHHIKSPYDFMNYDISTSFRAKVLNALRLLLQSNYIAFSCQSAWVWLLRVFHLELVPNFQLVDQAACHDSVACVVITVTAPEAQRNNQQLQCCNVCNLLPTCTTCTTCATCATKYCTKGFN